jgi:hypothetical protein
VSGLKLEKHRSQSEKNHAAVTMTFIPLLITIITISFTDMYPHILMTESASQLI